MWTNRTKSLGFALAISAMSVGAVIPSTAAAQDVEARFVDSWFWGVRGGAMSVKTNAQDKFAPMVGLEWLITRKRVGLNLAVGQSFFNDVSTVVPDDLGSPSEVRLQDYRFASASLYAFPTEWGNLRPYAGVGVALNQIRNASPQSPLDPGTAQWVSDSRSVVSAVLTLGAQAQVQNVAIFGEASLLPTKHEFLLNGSEVIWALNAGIRFNLGSSIEKFH